MEIVAGLISTAAVLYFPYRIVIENNITVQIGSSRQYSSIHLLSFTTVLPERFESPLSVYRTSIVQQITLELLAAITRYEKKHQRAMFLPLQRIDNSTICSVYVNSTFAAVVLQQR